jgi:hypothetical protein
MMSRFTDGRHLGAAVEEWVFAAWALDASLGVVSGHRIVGRNAWYWAALARAGRPLLHVIDDHIPVRADPFIVKGEALWAEHTRDAPMEQWSVCNETFASALADPDEALGNAYGDPTPIAFDLEWYATAEPVAFAPSLDGSIEGYEQAGVVHGAIEILGEPTVEFDEIAGHRWHRWTTAVQSSHDDATGSGPAMSPLPLPEVVAHTGVRVPFVFPDGTTADLVLTREGWRRRRR